jgi:hypothetical protein
LLSNLRPQPPHAPDPPPGQQGAEPGGGLQAEPQAAAGDGREAEGAAREGEGAGRAAGTPGGRVELPCVRPRGQAGQEGAAVGPLPSGAGGPAHGPGPPQAECGLEECGAGPGPSLPAALSRAESVQADPAAGAAAGVGADGRGGPSAQEPGGRGPGAAGGVTAVAGPRAAEGERMGERTTLLAG